jgi:hypothetical protein
MRMKKRSLLRRLSREEKIALIRVTHPEAEGEELEAHLQKFEEIICWSEGEGRAEIEASYQRSLQEKKEREKQEAEREVSYQRYLQEEYQRCLKELQEQAGE